MKIEPAYESETSLGHCNALIREFTIINLRIDLSDISIQQKSRWSAKASFCKKKQAFSLRWTIESVFA